MSQDTATAIMELLKRNGPMTAKALSAELGITSMGARQFLLNLREKEWLVDFDRAEKVGRPAKYWQLTAIGHRQFPDRHSELTLQMIESVKVIFGDEGLEKLIADREEKMQQQYLQALQSCHSIGDKVACLAKLRSDEGYMAMVEQKDDGTWLLIETHCPICSAAQQCQSFCRSELEIFQQCFADTAKVEREEHILNDSFRCVYAITPV
ncbi:metalloregulator ArsR/SmtB family transcription factor [Pleionea sp. CnH1-48]|uniref:helix-turn-helix transcriptional regulator n=1 Tax=Pleionea sp. CnH1-48 TaxID=2954494 RepID=UPI002096F53F|nr:metalloregulator ArsR/SmtB family transcription factor [Pleionea sp. CnH1-48]MCO7223734.1 transcriptional regulator [Pleionea sp. CnH1-48]